VTRPAASDAVDEAKARILRIAAVVYVAAVLAFSLVPTRGALEATVGERQTTTTLVAHFLEFAALGVLVTRAAATRRSRNMALLVGLGVGLVVAAATELVQLPLPYRSMELRDLAVDAAGLATGLLLVSLWPSSPRGAAARRG
jgi:VanZ family protein